MIVLVVVIMVVLLQLTINGDFIGFIMALLVHENMSLFEGTHLLQSPMRCASCLQAV